MNKLSKLGSNIVTVLDIGTTKIACFIAEISPSHDVRIVGIGYQISRGIKGGVITDLKRAEGAIRAAVAAAEQMAEITVDRVIVNISSAHNHSHRVNVMMPISGQEITARDVARLKEQATAQLHSTEREVIHCIPLEYTIDGTPGIREPEGMYGNQLRGQMHVITASSMQLINLSSCLAKCHLDIEEFMAAGYASGLACLEEDEKELGALLIDIGGGHTVLSYFKAGAMAFTDSLPIGSAHLTNDLALGLSTSIASAERVKTLFGSAMSASRDEHEMIDIPQMGEHGEQETSSISRMMLIHIIRPRVEEIMEMIKERLAQAGLTHFSGKVVLTGGGAQLNGIKEVASQWLERQVRIGLPQRFEGMAESTKGPAFSTCVGMLIAAVEHQKKNSFSRYASTGMVQKMLRWVRGA